MEENKKLINAKCPYCGKDFVLEQGEIKVTCDACNTEMPVSMAKKYYESLNENPTEIKEAHGEDYHKLSLILDEINGLIKIEAWQKAEEKFYEALELSDSDYKVYMAMVAIKTKNYTDLKDEEHKEYINKAIACADAEAKKEIVKSYKEYYRKLNLSEEELKTYSHEETKIKKAKLEKDLKSMIPEYMAKEKHNKVFLILFPILILIGATVVVLSMIYEELSWFSIGGAVVTIIGYLLFRTWVFNRDKVRTFNSILDLYDFIDGNGYDDQTLGVLYSHMQNICDKFLDNIPIVSMYDDTGRLIDYVITMNDSSMNSFMLSSKYFSQFVSADEE